MKTNRRQFLSSSASLGGALALTAHSPGSLAATVPSFAVGQSHLKLGLVTYNLAKDWNIDTIIKNCEETRFEGVELRTSHAHKVETYLTAIERAEVRRRFRDSKVQLMGLGSTFDFHTSNGTKLRADIESAKQYLQLAHDVGATGIKVRPNEFPVGVPHEKTLDQIGHSLAVLGDFARDLGLVIRLEVHGEGTSLLPNIRRIMDTANHSHVGVCWNSNQTDLEGAGFDHNFDLVKDKIFSVHLRDLYLEEYPFRKLFTRLNETGFSGFTMAEIPESHDPVRVMRYFRGLWLAYQNLL
jgi:sugar phosphate isomerase/epimerase